MSHIQPVVQAVSHIADLGSLAAATLGINVAYLSLERFRYREQIRKSAIEQLVSIGEESTLPDSIKKSVQYRDLVYLAKLLDHDGLDESKKRLPIKGHTPSGGWAFCYRMVFSHHQDLFATTLISAASVFLLLVGIATSIGIWSALRGLGYGGWLESGFWVLAIGLFVPGICVLLGRRVVRKGCAHAVDCGSQTAALIKDIAKGARPPPHPEAGDGAAGLPVPVGPEGAIQPLEAALLNEIFKALGKPEDK